jgi:hypothetical protein
MVMLPQLRHTPSKPGSALVALEWNLNSTVWPVVGVTPAGMVAELFLPSALLINTVEDSVGPSYKDNQSSSLGRVACATWVTNLVKKMDVQPW